MNLEEAIEFFRDKSVILVGNSVELMNHEYADFIDSHDIVVRFGKAISADETEQKSIGVKTDVWVTGSFRAPMILQEPYKSRVKDAKILFVRSRIHMSKQCNKIPEISHALDMFSDEEIIGIYSKYGVRDDDPDSRRLSAGAWTIKFLCEKVKSYKSLTLIGFDFFVKYTTSRRGGNIDPHSWHRPIGIGKRETHWHEQEVKIVNEFINRGLLSWKILSDLSPQEIKNTSYGKY